RRLDGGVGEVIQRRTLRVVGLNRLLDLIDRQAGDLATVLAAHLRQLVGSCSRSRGARCRRRAAPTWRPTWRQIAGESVISVRSENAGIDVVVPVVPERRVVAIAPHRVAVPIVIGERPEQRANPAIAAVAVSPPSISAAAMLPSRRRGTGRDPSAHIRIAQRGPVMQCASDRARIQRALHPARSDAGVAISAKSRIPIPAGRGVAILRQRRSTVGAASVAVGRERAVAAKTRSRCGTRYPRPADMPSAAMRATETGAPAARARTAETCSPEVAAAAAETGTATEVTATTTEVTAATAKVTAATAKVTAA